MPASNPYTWNGGENKTWHRMYDGATPQSIPISEIYTTHMENLIRSENGLPLRNKYENVVDGAGYAPPIIRRTNVDGVYESVYFNPQGETHYKRVKKGFGYIFKKP